MKYFLIAGLLLAATFVISASSSSSLNYLSKSYADTLYLPLTLINSTHLQIYNHSDVGQTITISDQVTYFNITGWELGNSNRMEIQDDHAFVNETGTYFIVWSLSFGNAGGANDEYQISLLVNNANNERCEAHRKMGTGGDVGTTGSTCIIGLTKGDKLRLGIKNLDSNADAIVYTKSISLSKLELTTQTVGGLSSVDDVWVNESGDTMTGELILEDELTINDNIRLNYGTDKDAYTYYNTTDGRTYTYTPGTYRIYSTGETTAALGIYSSSGDVYFGSTDAADFYIVSGTSDTYVDKDFTVHDNVRLMSDSQSTDKAVYLGFVNFGYYFNYTGTGVGAANEIAFFTDGYGASNPDIKVYDINGDGDIDIKTDITMRDTTVHIGQLLYTDTAGGGIVLKNSNGDNRYILRESDNWHYLTNRAPQGGVRIQTTNGSTGGAEEERTRIEITGGKVLANITYHDIDLIDYVNATIKGQIKYMYSESIDSVCCSDGDMEQAISGAANGTQFYIRTTDGNSICNVIVWSGEGYAMGTSGTNLLPACIV